MGGNREAITVQPNGIKGAQLNPNVDTGVVDPAVFSQPRHKRACFDSDSGPRSKSGHDAMDLAAGESARTAAEQISVLHVYKTYMPDSMGGLEQAIYQTCRGTTTFGIRNTVFTLTPHDGPRQLIRAEADVHRYPTTLELASCPMSLRALVSFRRHVLSADIVHYHFPWPFADLLDFQRPRSTPAVLTYHSDIIRQVHLHRVYRPLEQHFLGKMSRIVATSANYFRTSDVLQKFRDRVEVIPFGLDETSYPPVDPGRQDYWRSCYENDFFLFVGVLRYYKGLDILLRAARQRDFKILIVGAGPTERELKYLASDLALDNVFFLGSVSDEDKVALLSLSRAVVFPSHLRAEALGISLLEAAMFGKPMISSEIGTGTSYVNVHGETGLVVPPSDSAALAAAMDRLRNDRALCQTMGIAARRRFERLFTGERMATEYLQLYESVLAPRRDRIAVRT